MPIIRVTSGVYCRGEEVVQKTAEVLGYEVLDDRVVIAETAKRFNLAESKLQRTLAGKVSAFNNFTRERERNLSCLKVVVAGLLERDDFILHGVSGQIIPASISHVLRVCVISEMNRRVELAVKDLGWTAKEAQKHIRKEDEAVSLWTQHVLKADPWDAEIYDILIPTHKVQTDEAVQLVVRNARSGAVLKTKDSELAAMDFALAALVEGELGKAGHEVVVTARNGKVTLSINRHTLMLSNLEEELKRLAKRVQGVQEVETKVGPGFYQAGVYRQVDVELPSRVLLVDDEREFVQTLSERLSMRDLGSVAVYDGEQALSFVEEEEPEVIVLDLRMPGIDGIEVLRRIKADHPDIEVIILTGHGSEKDQEVCMELGAFAYLQKPVDIEKLSETMKAAYQKVKERRT